MPPTLNKTKIADQVAKSPIVLSAEEISSCVQDIAGQVQLWAHKERENQSSQNNSLRIISILDGATYLTNDLVKVLKPVECEVIGIKVRATADTKLLDQVEIESGHIPSPQAEDQPLLIVDDLVDSGKTLVAVEELARELGYKNIRSAALINKYAEVSIASYLGRNLQLDKFTLAKDGITDYWLFGYGMDIGGDYRDLDYLGWIEIKTNSEDLP